MARRKVVAVSESAAPSRGGRSLAVGIQRPDNPNRSVLTVAALHGAGALQHLRQHQMQLRIGIGRQLAVLHHVFDMAVETGGELGVLAGVSVSSWMPGRRAAKSARMPSMPLRRGASVCHF